MAWRSSCGTWKFLDGNLYRKVNQNGKTDVWVCVSDYPTSLEDRLLKIIEEILSESKNGSAKRLVTWSSDEKR